MSSAAKKKITATDTGPQGAPRVGLSWAGEAEVTSFLHIPTGWTIQINDRDYKCVECSSSGISVIAYRENGISWAGEPKAPASVLRRATEILWDDIRTLHVY